MKLQLEFEEDDLREMITQYFAGNGFHVKNLDQLCALFSKAFPDGIKVQAETVPMVTPLSTFNNPITNEVVLTDKVTSTLVVETGNPVFTASDLFDPEPGTVPSRDEQLRQSKAELEHILRESETLKKKA